MDHAKELSELKNQFIYWVGDHMHNFGVNYCSNDMDKVYDLKWSGRDQEKMKDIFVMIRYIGTRDNFKDESTMDFFETTYRILGFNEDFQEEIKGFYDRVDSLVEEKRFQYKVLITGLKQLLPAIADTEYHFKDAYPQSLEDLDNQVYTIKSNFAV